MSEMKNIGLPEQPVETWLLRCMNDCLQEADEAWMPWTKKRFRAMAFAYWTSCNFVRQSKGLAALMPPTGTW